ncbi:hypothetical protein GpartN1_g3821.t1 [Galdieria partita]|uniref:Uncharacterized protein n=1 Tax=Galdieria partita TaxID=83374 RepID=A0A9C7PX24_9RHOD|nr:hypothetical protein GpartN1_g3821.t1 [Galdieria partita]
MLFIKEAKVSPFQSKVFDPFKLVVLLENQTDGLISDFVVRYVRDCSLQAESRCIFELKGIFLESGSQKIFCENISLGFLKEFHEWEYCNVGYLELLLLAEGEQKVLISLNLVVQIFTDRQYSGALKRVYSYLSTADEVVPAGLHLS